MIIISHRGNLNGKFLEKEKAQKNKDVKAIKNKK